MITGSDTSALDLLLEKVYRESGYDFRQYRRNTVTRRLERRLRATGAKTCLDYSQFLDTHPEEYERLAEDLTIKVSSFFRNAYTFQQVTRLVLPELVASKRKQGERRLRFWSTGCARGEEPYSLAILLTEFLGHELSDFNITVYATDISQQALKETKAGTYSAWEVSGLSTAFLENYFVCRNQSYVVKNNIRQMLRVFYFDLTAPTKHLFINLDCVFCCNVLIYLQKQLQERVLSMLYDSLAAPGYLILGEAETPTSNLSEKLECPDNQAKIYKKAKLL